MGLTDNQRRAIEELYQEMFYPLSAYANSALSDRALAEEAVQDTFRIACAKVGDFLSSPNPKGWLINTLKNVIHNTVRSRAYLNRIVVYSLNYNVGRVSADADTPDLDFMYSDLTENEDYKLLKKIALEKYSMLEAAQVLGISVEACKKRVQRAKKKLKKHFADNS